MSMKNSTSWSWATSMWMRPELESSGISNTIDLEIESLASIQTQYGWTWCSDQLLQISWSIHICLGIGTHLQSIAMPMGHRSLSKILRCKSVISDCVLTNDGTLSLQMNISGKSTMPANWSLPTMVRSRRPRFWSIKVQTILLRTNNSIPNAFCRHVPMLRFLFNTANNSATITATFFWSLSWRIISNIIKPNSIIRKRVINIPQYNPRTLTELVILSSLHGPWSLLFVDLHAIQRVFKSTISDTLFSRGAFSCLCVRYWISNCLA